MIEKKSVAKIVDGLTIGEKAEFPPERYRYITSTCSDYGFITGKKFRVVKNREKRIVEVIRES